MMTQAEIFNIREEISQTYQKMFYDNENKIKEILNRQGRLSSQQIQEKIKPLIYYFLDRASVALFLSENSKWVDSEIIFRTVLEIFIKIFYILVAEDEKIFNRRLKEYWEIIGLFEQKRQSDKAKEMVKYSKDRNASNIFGFMVLDSEAENKIINHPDYGNKNSRTQLKESWSFAGISKSLSAHALGKELHLPLLGYYYKMSSHRAHADEMAIQMEQERAQRSPEHLNLLNLNSYMKMVRAINVLTWQIILALNLYENNAPELLKSLADYNKFFLEIGKLHKILEYELGVVGGYYKYDDLSEK